MQNKSNSLITFENQLKTALCDVCRVGWEGNTRNTKKDFIYWRCSMLTPQNSLVGCQLLLALIKWHLWENCINNLTLNGEVCTKSNAPLEGFENNSYANDNDDDKVNKNARKMRCCLQYSGSICSQNSWLQDKKAGAIPLAFIKSTTELMMMMMMTFSWQW